MQNKLFRKCLVVAIIFLFIEIVVTPDMTAQNYRINNNSLETHAEELVECPIEIYGVEGLLKYTVMLTQNQIDELDTLFDNIKTDLNTVETEEETIIIFNNAMVLLDELGLFPAEMSVEEAQQFIVKGNVKADELNLQYVKEHENFDCNIIGRTTNTYFKGNEGDITFGLVRWQLGIGSTKIPALGFVLTIGSNGIKISLVRFYGQLRIIEEGDEFSLIEYYHVGAEGFEGFKIKTLYYTYLLGYATHVALGSNPLIDIQNINQNSQRNSQQSSPSSTNYKEDFNNIVGGSMND